MKADRTLGMTRRMDHFEFGCTEFYSGIIGYIEYLTSYGFHIKSEIAARLVGRKGKIAIIGMNISFEIPFVGNALYPHYMIKMAMSEKNFDGNERVFPYKLHQTSQFIVILASRIHNHTLAGVIPNQIASHPQFIKIETFIIDHNKRFVRIIAKIRKRVCIFVNNAILSGAMHIAIAGNIGSGKTTLTKMLAEHYGWTPRYESVDYNPYLVDFYNDMERWSFNIQIYFLNKRFLDVVEISKSDDVIVQDRSIYEDARIFAPNLHAMGLMATRDYENYASLFSLMVSLVKAPDLLIYLRSSIPNLVNNIQKRGREYESSIRLDYLKGLNERYEKWIEEYKDGNLLIIDVDNLNFQENPLHFRTITDKIDAQLHGLF
jgi:deoxyadenosine/deoxycytidine kinase